MSTKDAIETLSEALKDDEYYNSWLANIAMAYQDEGYRQKSKDSAKKRHAISNQAAKNFLKLLFGVEAPRES